MNARQTKRMIKRLTNQIVKLNETFNWIEIQLEENNFSNRARKKILEDRRFELKWAIQNISGAIEDLKEYLKLTN